MSGHHHLTKKEAKAAQRKKNQFHERLFNMLRQRRAEEVRVKDLAKVQAPKKEEKSNPEWSDKVSTVRNRLTGKKRESKERWNRFAGTSDGGGRGL